MTDIPLKTTNLYRIEQKRFWIEDETTKETPWETKWQNPHEVMVREEISKLRASHHENGYIFRIVHNKEEQIINNQTKVKRTIIREIIIDSDIPGENSVILSEQTLGG